MKTLKSGREIILVLSCGQLPPVFPFLPLLLPLCNKTIEVRTKKVKRK